MILADTSVWVEHLRTGGTALTTLLTEGVVSMHPFIVGELACGNLRARETTLSSLEELPQVTTATHAEVLHLVASHRLWGKGLGWVDLHLLASAVLSQCHLWTIDSRLQRAASDLGVCAPL